jgi:biopolymer transport protein ExbB
MPTLPRSTSWWSGRIKAWTVFVAGSLLCLALVPTPRILAQDAKGERAAESTAAAKAAAPASSEGSAAPKPKSMLRWALEASGPFGIFLRCSTWPSSC